MSTQEFIKWVVHNEQQVYSFLRANSDLPQPGKPLEEAILNHSSALEEIRGRYDNAKH